MELRDGRWWFLDPAGQTFLSKGVCHITFQGDSIQGTGASPYREAVQAKYGHSGGIEAWREATARRLLQWGFNSLGAWSDDKLSQAVWEGRRLANAPIIDLGAHFVATSGQGDQAWLKGIFPDVFSPEFEPFCRRAAQEQCAPRQNDPTVLGWFTDNELRWGPDWRGTDELLTLFLNLPATAPGRQAAIRLLKSRHNTIGKFNAVWKTAFASWEDLEQAGHFAAPVKRKAVYAQNAGEERQANEADPLRAAFVADCEAFLAGLADRYFRVTRDALGAADPNHLNFGCRFAYVPPGPVLTVAGHYLDVISFNCYQTDPEPTVQKYAQVGKPLVIGEFTFRAQDVGLPNTKGAGPVVKTQADRAAAFDRYVRTVLRHPQVVGYHWFQFSDQPKEGRFDGENSNYGVVNIQDEIYPALTARMTQANQSAESWHQGRGEPSAKLRALILSGRNNHDWRQTTPALKAILEDSGRFVVEVTEDPSVLDAPSLERFDVLVSNWSAWPDLTGRQWGGKAEQAILEFVRRGKGLALFHAASATFHDWPEFQKMVGATWDLATTGHGPPHPFKVTIADANHPVTQGLSDFWIRDELWHRIGLRSTNQVLATAFSSKDKGGSGQAEPVLFVSEYGQGRCFYLVLGHDAETMKNPAWQTLMRRGVEWAGTGRVTVPVPSAWPGKAAALPLLGFADSRWQITVDDNRVAFHTGDQVWLDYRYGGVPFKPYVRQLFSPQGRPVLRDAPFDHLHHHGLMYAVGVNGTNFWEEIPQAGFQQHASFSNLQVVQQGPEQFARLSETLHWVTTNRQTVVLDELRTLALSRRGTDNPPVLTWQTVFTLPAGRPSVALTGAHYYGLGLRFPVEMDNTGPFLNSEGSEGEIFRGEERLVDSAWCAYRANPDGKPITVAMFAHPGNARFPTTWFMMKQPFAYLSATMRLQEKPWILEPGTRHRETYGVVVWDKPAGKDEIEAAYQAWLNSAAVAALLP